MPSGRKDVWTVCSRQWACAQCLSLVQATSLALTTEVQTTGGTGPLAPGVLAYCGVTKERQNIGQNKAVQGSQGPGRKDARMHGKTVPYALAFPLCLQSSAPHALSSLAPPGQLCGGLTVGRPQQGQHASSRPAGRP